MDNSSIDYDLIDADFLDQGGSMFPAPDMSTEDLLYRATVPFKFPVLRCVKDNNFEIRGEKERGVLASSPPAEAPLTPLFMTSTIDNSEALSDSAMVRAVDMNL